jgi:coenzyme F420 biosynthesis associated uncharacterized protein
MKQKMTRGLVTGVLAGLAMAAVAEVVRPRGGVGQLLDWDEIKRLAGARLGDDDLSGARRAALSRQYRRLAAELEAPLLETVGGEPVEMPPFQALSRVGWLDLNIGILREAIDPLLETARIPNSHLITVSRAGVDRYVALLLSFLGRRVLGQFDPQLMGREPVNDPSKQGLYLVEPNIDAWEDEEALDGEQLRRWLILHEMTHAWQFAAHPWLRDHMNSMLGEVLTLAGEVSREPLARFVSLTVGLPRQWRTVRRMQATMSLIEGYSNLVMNLAGRKLLRRYDDLEEAYRRRSGQRGVLETLFWKVTGLDLKLQQYERGEKFARAIYDKHGMKTLNLAWQSADHLPRLDELDDPEEWYRRIAGEGRARAAAGGRGRARPY